MAETPQGHLVVSNGQAEVARVPLASGRMVIGRSTSVEVPLPNGSVSREHAELFADPFDRWWIRDLASRNGTIVNGETIEEHLLEPDDTIQIEHFLLTLELAGPAKQRPRRQSTTVLDAGLSITDTDTDKVSRLEDMATPSIDASHLSTLTEFSKAG